MQAHTSLVRTLSLPIHDPSLPCSPFFYLYAFSIFYTCPPFNSSCPLLAMCILYSLVRHLLIRHSCPLIFLVCPPCIHVCLHLAGCSFYPPFLELILPSSMLPNFMFTPGGCLINVEYKKEGSLMSLLLLHPCLVSKYSIVVSLH